MNHSSECILYLIIRSPPYNQIQYILQAKYSLTIQNVAMGLRLPNINVMYLVFLNSYVLS